MVNAPIYRSWGPGSESCWRQNSAHEYKAFHCTELSIIILTLPQYGLNTVESNVKHQIIMIISWITCLIRTLHLFPGLLSAEELWGVKKGYPCRYCSKEFTAPSWVRRHERIHTGEKPFPCDICGKCFNTKHGMKSHKLIHLLKSSEKTVGTKIWNKMIWKDCKNKNIKWNETVHLSWMNSSEILCSYFSKGDKFCRQKVASQYLKPFKT